MFYLLFLIHSGDRNESILDGGWKDLVLFFGFFFTLHNPEVL